MSWAVKGLLLLFTVIALAGCGGGGGSAVSTSSLFAGTWLGTWSFTPDSQGISNGATSQSGTLTLDIGENGVVTGTIRNTISDGPSMPQQPLLPTSSTSGQIEGWIKSDGKVKFVFTGCKPIFPNNKNPASSYICKPGPLSVNSARRLVGSAYFTGYDITNGTQVTIGNTGKISFNLAP